MIDEETKLPKAIDSDGILYRLEYGYYGELDDKWWLSYASYRKHPHKKVYLQREESTLARCVAGAKRDLKRNPDWQMV